MNDVKLVKRIRNRIATILITVIVTFTIFGIFIGEFGGVLFQEGNPIKVGSAILKLQFTDQDYVEIENGKYIANFEGNEASVLKSVMESDGWQYIEQMGSGYVFQNGEERITIGTRKLTNYFYVWQMAEKPTKRN